MSFSRSTETLGNIVDLIDSGVFGEESQMIAAEYIPDLESVCIAANTGEIVLYKVSTKEVGSFIILIINLLHCCLFVIINGRC